jgi:hypothetical protein
MHRVLFPLLPCLHVKVMQSPQLGDLSLKGSDPGRILGNALKLPPDASRRDAEL